MLAACAFVAIVALPDQLGIDDAFINLRYARNLAEGHGLCFTPGDSVNGCTSPPFACLLALLHVLLRLDLLQTAAVAQVALMVGLGYATRRLCGDGPFAVLGWLVVPFVATRPYVASCTGMDGVLFLTAAVAAMAASRGRGQIGFGLALGMLCIVRPEGGLLAAILFGYRCARQRRLALGVAAVAAVPVTAAALYMLWRFGSLLPATGMAKLEHARSGLWPTFGHALLQEALPDNLGLGWLLAAGIGAALLLWRDKGLFVVLALWTALHNGALLLSGVAGYRWYFMPLFLQLALFAILGAERLLEALWRGRGAWPFRVVTVAVAAALLAIGVSCWRGQKRDGLWPTQLEPVQNRYLHLGRWLHREAPAGASLGSLEIGMLGFYSQLPMVDFCGLVTPDVAWRMRSRTHVRYAIDTLRPELVLGHSDDGAMEEGLRERVAQQYRLVRQLDDCRVYRRLPDDRAAWVEALVRALPSATGVLQIEAPWPAFDAAEFGARLAAAGWRLAGADEPPTHVAAAGLDDAWSVVAAAALAPVVFDAAALAGWQAGNVVGSQRVDGGVEYTAASPLPFVGARIDVSGPVVAVRARCRVRPLVGAALPAGRQALLYWTSSTYAQPRAGEGVRAPVPVGSGEFEVEFRLPAQRFVRGEVLQRLYLSPADAICAFTVLRVEVLRH